ncbi:MAG: hypothetical protein RR369_05490, partial [Lachnospiraceae bacterium]
TVDRSSLNQSLAYWPLRSLCDIAFDANLLLLERFPLLVNEPRFEVSMQLEQQVWFISNSFSVSTSKVSPHFLHFRIAIMILYAPFRFPANPRNIGSALLHIFSLTHPH